MKWQSEENVGLDEAAEWARHFGQLEKDMDAMLADLFGVSRDMMNDWINPGRYVCGSDLAGAGLAELISAAELTSDSPVVASLDNGAPMKVSKPKLRKAP